MIERYQHRQLAKLGGDTVWRIWDTHLEQWVVAITSTSETCCMEFESELDAKMECDNLNESPL